MTHLPRHLSFSNLTGAFQLLAAYVIFAPIYAISLYKCFNALRSPHPESAARASLIATVGLALLLEVAQSPSWFRLYCLAAPAIALLPWLLDGPGRLKLQAVRLLWISAICIAAHDTWSRYATYSVVENFPGGRLATTPLSAEKLSWLAGRTQANEFVLQAAWPGVYLPLGLRNPLCLEDLETGGERQLGYVDASIQQLSAKHVRLILWSPILNSPAFDLEPLREYIEKRYRRIWVFSDRDEVWETRS
ncbi:MAG: hypothetical protein JSR66_13095 [Proteobacteria bacterium]|nr:hypothetical protein [Pseudomonadota bacterium]